MIKYISNQSINISRIISALIYLGSIVIIAGLYFMETNKTEKYIKNLSSNNIISRCEAAYMLGEKEEETAIAPMLKILRNPSEPVALKKSIMQALGNIKDKSATPALIEILAQGDNQLTLSAITSLGMLEDKTATEPLLQLLTNQELLLATIRTLGDIKDPTAVPALTEQTKSQDNFVSYNATLALKRIGQAN